MLQTLIVGCGAIAGGFDSGGESTGQAPLTHAGAYARDGRFHLAACVDPDRAKRESFMKHWGIGRGFESLSDISGCDAQFDVISICSPTPVHAANLEACLELSPKLIFCEKPLTHSVAHSDRLVTACAERGVSLAVNYTRRWDPAVADLRRGMKEGSWGALRAVVGYYNKGLLNNGSHMLDLLAFLLGELRVVCAGRPVADFFPDDPSVPFELEASAGVPIHIACGDARDFALFELELVFADAVVRMEEGGLYWRERRAVASEIFPGYRVAGGGERRRGRYAESMLRAVGNIFGAVTQGSQLASSGHSALTVQRMCEEIRTS